MVQAVAELMEQGDHIIVRKQCRLVTNRAGEVAHHVGYRVLHHCTITAASDGIVHPGPATFALACIQVEIELADQRAISLLDAEEADIRMPDFRCLRFDV